MEAERDPRLESIERLEARVDHYFAGAAKRRCAERVANLRKGIRLWGLALLPCFAIAYYLSRIFAG